MSQYELPNRPPSRPVLRFPVSQSREIAIYLTDDVLLADDLPIVQELLSLFVRSATDVATVARLRGWPLREREG